MSKKIQIIILLLKVLTPSQMFSQSTTFPFHSYCELNNSNSRVFIVNDGQSFSVSGPIKITFFTDTGALVAEENHFVEKVIPAFSENLVLLIRLQNQRAHSCVSQLDEKWTTLNKSKIPEKIYHSYNVLKYFEPYFR